MARTAAAVIAQLPWESDEQDTIEVGVYSAENLLLRTYERA